MRGGGTAPRSMAPTNLLPPVIACAESISLLYLLHSVPTLPSSNPLDSVRLRQEGYTLPFTREQNLVDTLAFLSNAKDDPNHIAALCIEEDPESSFLSVLLAVNRLKWDDGDQILQELRRGFERIFAILSRVSEGHGARNVEDDTFTAIISMCSHRVLRRLRFVANNRQTPKQPIKEVFQAAIGSFRQLGKKTLGEQLSLSILFAEKAKEVIKLADSWAKHQTTAQLKDLVEGIYRLRRIGDIQTLLDTIPNRAMCPSMRRNLFNIISKVARYREAARFLYRTAKRFRLIRQMKIVLVNLPREAFYRLPADQYTPRLASTVTRINAVGRQRDLGRICRLMKTTEVQADDQFANQTRKTLREAKIHAEIQLLFYCELNASKLPPRVICSSKDACFLCNAFILTHGKMHMSRYHGRLYPGWRLPLMSKFNDVDQRFNVVLENQVRDSLNTLLSRGQKTVYPDPNEGTLLTLSPSASTLHSLALPTEAIGGKEEIVQAHSTDETAREDIPLIPPDPRVLSTSSEKILNASSAAGTEVTTGAEEDVEIQSSNYIALQSILLNPCSSQELFSKSADIGGELIQGLVLSKSVTVDHRSSLYTAGSLEVHIEYAMEKSPPSSKSASKEFGYSIGRLGAEEAKRLREHRAASIIDVEALQDETSYEVDDQNCLFIAARGAVVKIVLLPGFK